MSINSIWTFITTYFPEVLSVGTVVVLLGWIIPHFLSKSRDKENFNRSVDHEKSEKKAIILSQLGVFANGILNCWEEGTVLANNSKYGPRSTPLTSPKKIEFKDYETLKHKLVELGVFDANVWHSLDRLPGQINKYNAPFFSDQ